jgi:uncharacterized YigZ family protein
MSYLCFARRGESTRVVQKSKFLGVAMPISSEAEAQEVLAQLRETYATASAIAWAYIIDVNIQRFHDGGEPSGTAGMPILSVLQKRGLTRCFCAVVRWFGGIKLGAGGLARAFSGCAADAMDNAGTALWCPTAQYDVRIDYADLGKIEYRLAEYPFERLDTVFTDAVTLRMRVKAEQARQMLNLFDEWTGANMLAEPVGDVYDYPWQVDTPSV